METRSNHVLVGTVTLLLLAAIMIAAFWFSRLSDGENKEYDIFFKQSVDGLAKGSGVDYNGVPVGPGRGSGAGAAAGAAAALLARRSLE